MLAKQKGDWPWPRQQGKTVRWEDRGTHVIVHDGFQEYRLSKHDFDEKFERVWDRWHS